MEEVLVIEKKEEIIINEEMKEELSNGRGGEDE